MITLYEELKKIDAIMEHYHSDLYVKANKEVEKILNEINVRYTPFYSEGEKWYEIDFAYDPYWDEITEKTKKWAIGKGI